MSPFHLPIADDPQEQRRIVRLWARRARPPAKLVAKATGLRPAERIALLYPAGVRQGVLYALRAIDSQGIALPKDVPSWRDTGTAEAWAEGIALAASLPPKAAFQQKVRDAIPTIYKAGVERGMILALAPLKRV